MLGVSFWELILIVVAVVVFVKPEEMPAFFRKIGKLYAEVQHYIRQMRSYTADSVNQWAKEADAVTGRELPPPGPTPSQTVLAANPEVPTPTIRPPAGNLARETSATPVEAPASSSEDTQERP